MTPFVDRIVYQRMVDGLQPFLDDSRLFERFLILGGLSAEEAAKGKEYIETKPPHPIYGYARQGSEFPALAMTLGTEGVEQDYLNEDAAMLDEDGDPYFDDDGNPIDYKIRRWSHRFDIFVYADHPDVTLYYYQLLKHILVSSKSYFQEQDLDEITYNGAEMAPDPRYVPSDMYVRRFSINLRADQSYIEELLPGVGPGKNIDVFIDDGEPNIPANEGLKTNVTPYVSVD